MSDDAFNLFELPTCPRCNQQHVGECPRPARVSTKRAGPQSTNRDDAAITNLDNQRARRGTR